LYLAAGSPIAPGLSEAKLPEITDPNVVRISGKEVVRIDGTRTNSRKQEPADQTTRQ